MNRALRRPGSAQGGLARRSNPWRRRDVTCRSATNACLRSALTPCAHGPCGRLYTISLRDRPDFALRQTSNRSSAFPVTGDGTKLRPNVAWLRAARVGRILRLSLRFYLPAKGHARRLFPDSEVAELRSCHTPRLPYPETAELRSCHT